MKKLFINPTVKFNEVESAAIIASSPDNSGGETKEPVNNGGAARQMHQTISPTVTPSADALDL